MSNRIWVSISQYGHYTQATRNSPSLSIRKRPLRATVPSLLNTPYLRLISLERSDTKLNWISPIPPLFLGVFFHAWWEYCESTETPMTSTLRFLNSYQRQSTYSKRNLDTQRSMHHLMNIDEYPRKTYWKVLHTQNKQAKHYLNMQWMNLVSTVHCEWIFLHYEF